MEPRRRTSCRAATSERSARSVKHGDINKFIAHYNSTSAGQLTPAGQALVTAGLFTSGQLASRGRGRYADAAFGQLRAGQVGVAPLFTFDLHISWELKVNKLDPRAS